MKAVKDELEQVMSAKSNTSKGASKAVNDDNMGANAVKSHSKK